MSAYFSGGQKTLDVQAGDGAFENVWSLAIRMGDRLFKVYREGDTLVLTEQGGQALRIIPVVSNTIGIRAEHEEPETDGKGNWHPGNADLNGALQDVEPEGYRHSAYAEP